MSQIDQTALDNLRALQRPGSPSILHKIIDLFLVQVPDAVKAILDGVESGDLESIRIAAHTIKSSAAYVGALDFSTKMADIERAAREEQLTLCQELTVGLNEEATQVMAELSTVKELAA